MANVVVGVADGPFQEGACFQSPEANNFHGKLPDGTPIVLKCLHTAGAVPEVPRLPWFLGAHNILRNHPHPYILPSLGLSQYHPGYTTVVTLEHGHSILDSLWCMNNKEILKMAIKLTRGVAHLHALGFPHGNIRASNVLVDDRWVLKLVDIGFSLLYSGEGFNLRTSCLSWTAPELLPDREDEVVVEPTAESDVYGLGMTILEMYTGKPPFFGFPDVHRFNFWIKLKLEPSLIGRLTKPGNMPWGVWNIIQDCWNMKPLQRPTAYQVLVRLEALM
ncbi:hypothetical protein JAAARDRAFT_57946 [Jaapia argillacea MUCL 33604]|uniref:Protein kinase domain-containing protein n=1 Tax=Jaapia argillacea MUCL 33604 TaxID=933084 RepID=A0A067PTW4_9AGAM|nr:hypothetical protein JAAARDRAFT_57946 [Jaapia argillacea MUCL 33604]